MPINTNYLLKQLLTLKETSGNACISFQHINSATPILRTGNGFEGALREFDFAAFVGHPVDPPENTSPCSVPPLGGSRQFDFHPAILKGVIFQSQMNDQIGNLRASGGTISEGKSEFSAMKWNFLQCQASPGPQEVCGGVCDS